MLESLEQLANEWGYALKELLEAQLQAGSPTAVFYVFAAGVVTSLTPCVYPMIPVTATFIGGAAGGDRRRAIGLSAVYVLAMGLMYGILGVIAAMIGAQFGSFTRHPAIFGLIGLLFLFFALAMLGVVNIRVPGVFSNVQAQGAQRGGYLGAFLMGIAAGFVAAPCTAPVTGVLLVYVADTGAIAWGGTLLLVYGLGIGMLLMLVGISAGALSSLPKPGPWMNAVKWIFGLGMMAVAAYFLYQAVRMLVLRA